MTDVKKGDVIGFGDRRQEVMGRLEDMIWVRELMLNGSVGDIKGPYDVYDLQTYGWFKGGAE